MPNLLIILSGIIFVLGGAVIIWQATGFLGDAMSRHSSFEVPWLTRWSKEWLRLHPTQARASIIIGGGFCILFGLVFIALGVTT